LRNSLPSLTTLQQYRSWPTMLANSLYVASVLLYQAQSRVGSHGPQALVTRNMATKLNSPLRAWATCHFDNGILTFIWHMAIQAGQPLPAFIEGGHLMGAHWPFGQVGGARAGNIWVKSVFSCFGNRYPCGSPMVRLPGIPWHPWLLSPWSPNLSDIRSTSCHFLVSPNLALLRITQPGTFSRSTGCHFLGSPNLAPSRLTQSGTFTKPWPFLSQVVYHFGPSYWSTSQGSLGLTLHVNKTSVPNGCSCLSCFL
jgi:hypothetical protein